MAYEAGKPLSLRGRLDRRKKAMWSERSSWDDHVRMVFDQTRPRRTRFSQTQTNKGDRRNKQIIDSTGPHSTRVLVSGLVNGMSSPSQPWFKYESDDLELMEYGPVRDWIGLLERLVRRIFNASNVYEALPTIYEELILAGTAAGVVEDDFEDVIRVSTFTWGEYALALNERRVVDTLYREMRMTTMQCVEKFGLGNVSTSVRSRYDCSDYDSWVDVCHAIEPNLDRDASKKDAANMAFRSIYWEASSSGPDQEKFLRRSGYRENPIIAPRWDVVGNDVYGASCPGMEALGDMRQLQIQQMRKGEAIDKQVRPPTQGPASLSDRMVSQLPGAHTPTNMNEGGIKPLFEVNPNLGYFIADIQETQERIREAFFVPYILAISQIEGVQPRNQWEISERKGEGLAVLGPVVQRLQGELHNPLHERVLNRIYDVCAPLWAAGEPAMLPPPPPELQGRPIQINYVSTLALAQKATQLASMERLINTVANPNVVQAYPEIRHKLDAHQWVDEFASHIGLPARIVRADDVVAQIAEQEAQQQQIQQMAAMAQPARDATQAAKNLSETNVGGGRGALEAMIEQAQETPQEAA